MWVRTSSYFRAPPRRQRQHQTPDGRSRRRPKRRYPGERLWAGRPAFRRLLVRGEGKAENDLGFVPLACVLILLRRTL
jgi:hypothetical protein